MYIHILSYINILYNILYYMSLLFLSLPSLQISSYLAERRHTCESYTCWVSCPWNPASQRKQRSSARSGATRISDQLGPGRSSVGKLL